MFLTMRIEASFLNGAVTEMIPYPPSNVSFFQIKRMPPSTQVLRAPSFGFTEGFITSYVFGVFVV